MRYWYNSMCSCSYGLLIFDSQLCIHLIWHRSLLHFQFWNTSLTFLFGVENLRFTSSASYLVIYSGCSNKARCYTARYFLLILPLRPLWYTLLSLSFVHVTRVEILRNFSFETEMGENPRVSLSLCRHQHSTGRMGLELLLVACIPADQEWRHI